MLDDFLRMARRDRYLMILPERLLTPAEADESAAAFRRFIAWLELRVAWSRVLLAGARQAAE